MLLAPGAREGSQVFSPQRSPFRPHFGTWALVPSPSTPGKPRAAPGPLRLGETIPETSHPPENTLLARTPQTGACAAQAKAVSHPEVLASAQRSGSERPGSTVPGRKSRQQPTQHDYSPKDQGNRGPVSSAFPASI